MEKIKQSSKKRKQKTGKRALNIKDTIKEINTSICSAQIHLLSECRNIITQMEKMEITLPTVFRQIIKTDGLSEMQKVSEVKVPFGYLQTPGVFQISHVEVDLPINIEATNRQAVKAKDPLFSSTKTGYNSQVTLKLSYEYHQLSNVLTPTILQFNPFLDLRFHDFNIDPKNQKKCSALGVIEALNEKTGKPLSGEKIYLNIEEGNVLPSEGHLNQEGKLEFRIIGSCQEGYKLITDMLILINGVTRTFNIFLTPEE